MIRWTKKEGSKKMNNDFVRKSHSFTENDLYVSPSGDDRWSGKLAETDANRTDGPLATITRA